jgi:hypothetical protein
MSELSLLNDRTFYVMIREGLPKNRHPQSGDAAVLRAPMFGGKMKVLQVGELH